MLGIKKKKQIQEKKTFFKETWKEEELIGEGSYGKVYKVKKEEFGIATYSAIKQIEIPQTKSEIQTLKTEGMTQNDITRYYEKSVQKWVEEIKFMSIFKDSENIVSIEDYEIIPKKNEIGFIINIKMELLKNLDAYILENNITDKEAIKMAIDVATALEDCEENNVVHRDIKPDNIFVNKKGIYKVGDFGIAKHIDKTISNMSKKGTENYMAPELYKNEKGNRTVDTYSLGIMLYRYFNYNRLPFLPNYPEEITMEAREEALYKRISGEKMPAPQNAIREIAEIILKACNYYPKDRYSSATELKTDLQKVYDQIDKPKILFDFNEKKMNKLFIENTKSDSHNGTLSVFESEQPKDQLDMTVGMGINEINDVHQDEEVIEKQPINEVVENEDEPIAEKEVQQDKVDNNEIEKNKIKEEVVQEDIKEEKQNVKIKERPKKEEKIKSPIWIKIKNNRYKIILALLVILIVLGIIFIPKFKKEEEQVPVIENVRMIQVVGLTSEEATQKIDELELEIQYEYEEVEDETQIGKVLEQSIQENQEVAKGTTVTIKVAVSKQKVVVPNVVGMNINDAIQQLTSMGLPINATGQYSNDVEKDIIISQMTPEGQEVNLGMTIEVLVSLGVEVQEQEDNNQNNQQTNNNVIQNKEWSGWVESLPSGVTANNYNIETKTQYSYRTKQTTTSANSSLDGWTQYDVKRVYGKSYGKFSYDSIYENTDKEEFTIKSKKTMYGYQHRCALYNGVWYASGTYPDFPEGAQTQIQSAASIAEKSTKLANVNTVSSETLYAIGNICSECGLDAWGYTGTSILYTYSVKEILSSTYYYYKWSDWTAYSDTVATSNDSTEVRTRTLYRYKAK